MEFLLVVLLVMAAIGGMAFFRAKSRIHSVNEMRAARDFNNSVGPTLPSWHKNQTKMEMFCDGVARMAQRDGIPMPFTKLALSDSKSNGRIFAYAANLEHQGSSFAEQQLGTVRFLLETWNDLDASQKAKIAQRVASGG